MHCACWTNIVLSDVGLDEARGSNRRWFDQSLQQQELWRSVSRSERQNQHLLAHGQRLEQRDFQRGPPHVWDPVCPLWVRHYSRAFLNIPLADYHTEIIVNRTARALVLLYPARPLTSRNRIIMTRHRLSTATSRETVCTIWTQTARPCNDFPLRTSCF